MLSSATLYRKHTRALSSLRVLVHLSRSNTEVSMFAPDKDQFHVINHCIGEPVDETRYV